ncbi:MAG TPA: DUF58 domain-containing protein [Candidatus Binatia bacterium]|nr:DUF58 domain-containing protein [Candidatus Binatia bacterium]
MAVGVFPLIPRRRVIGLAFGGVRSARRGTGSDVAGSREYRPGDDVAWIDWASSARLSAARNDDEFIVRELFADEAPRVVVLADRRPSMGIRASELRRLDKPQALLAVIDLIGASAHAARSLTGYVDHADGDVYWRPPRSERVAEPGAFERQFRAPVDAVSRGLEHLGRHRRDLPTQAFVFVVSDFIVPPDERVWQRALEHRWEIVPVILQDPVWERTFPDVGGITVSYADPATGGVVPIYLTHAEADRQRDANEARHEALIRVFRSLGTEPVVVGSHDPEDVLAAFLRWADLRVMARGAVA